MSELVKLGALWKGKDKDGQPMMTGSINGDVRLLVLKNGFKKEDKHPDYLLYLVPAEKKEKDKESKDADEDAPF